MDRNNALAELQSLAKKKRITQKKIVKWCRQARHEIYNELYGK